MMRRFVTILMATSVLGACSLEPKYVRPEAPVPQSWPQGDAYLQQSEAGLPILSYKQVFQDPNLQAVIAQALANNRDLRAAAANVASARAQYRIQRASLLPTVAAGADAAFGESGAGNIQTLPGSGNTGGNTGGGTGNGSGQVTTGGGTYEQYSVNLGISAYEIDLFGRLRSLSNAALNAYFATEAGARATRLSLVSEVANAYLTLAADRSLLAIAQDTVASAQRSVEITQARLQGGIAPRLDLRQAQTVLAQAQSDVANQRTLVAQDLNALQLLVGAPVADTLLPTSLAQVEDRLGEVPAGLSSEILLRRPDVVQAEFTLRSANAQIGAARAAFFPTISLTGLVGFASDALSNLFDGDAFNWSVRPSASLPIFTGGANEGNLDYAKAQRDLYLAQYEQTIQTAFREVSDALARRGTITDQLAAQQLLVTAAQDSYNLANARYQGGIDTFLSSLEAQRTLYNSRQSLISTELTSTLNLVALYQVLGGDAFTRGEQPVPEEAAPPAETTGG